MDFIEKNILDKKGFDNMALRNILYLDIEAINDYISQIDGYTYDEEIITSNSVDDKGGKAGIGFGKLTAEANLGKQNTNTTTKNVRITDSSKLDKVIKYLKNEDELKYYEEIDENIWQDIYRDDFLELLVIPRFSKIKEISNMAKNLNNLITAFQPYMSDDMIDSKTKEALSGFETISRINDTSMVSCVFNFENKKYPFIAELNTTFFKTDEENIKSQCYLLCKVQKKVEKGKSIELDEIFDNVKKLNLNREQKRKMPKDLSNPKELKDSIKGPAFVVTPIAIYR